MNFVFFDEEKTHRIISDFKLHMSTTCDLHTSQFVVARRRMEFIVATSFAIGAMGNHRLNDDEERKKYLKKKNHFWFVIEAVKWIGRNEPKRKYLNTFLASHSANSIKWWTVWKTITHLERDSGNETDSNGKMKRMRMKGIEKRRGKKQTNK